MKNEIFEIEDLKIYRNSTVIRNFKENLTLSDIIKIALIGKLNTLLIGERGEGKTVLLHEINSIYFDEKGIYIRARPDMKLKEIFERFNIDKFKFELKEIKDANFTMIDEINRAPEIIQNEFFHILDGYIEFENKKIILGNGYHITFATANYERKGGIIRYSGIFDMDSSIIDRFPLIINVDYFNPDPLDVIEIIENNKYEIKRNGNYVELFKKINKEIENVKLTLDAIISILYLRYGLDFCKKNKLNSKRISINSIPSICEGCHRLGEGCGYIFPPSMRFIKNLNIFSKAKNLYLKLKGIKKEYVDYIDIIESFSFLSPFNGIINNYLIETKYMGDAYLASMEIGRMIKRKIEEKKEVLKELFLKSFEGKLAQGDLDMIEENWNFIKRIIYEINHIAKEEGNLLNIKDKEKIEKILSKYKNPLLHYFLKND
ncbi:MAG: AAA family ATPase [candidate division WOR-3 bacterium]